MWRTRTEWDLNVGLWAPPQLCQSVLLCSAPRVSKSPRGLPWWCVLVGWLLVAATSGVAAFFTMLYGLHYGRASSLRWLISTAVSFVESVFITQPLKVLGFAAFFALVLKREDDEEALPPLPGHLPGPGPYALFRRQRRSSKDAYQPPLTTAVEKMKAARLKEQKAFALIREILGGQFPTAGLSAPPGADKAACPLMSPLLPLGLSSSSPFCLKFVKLLG